MSPIADLRPRNSQRPRWLVLVVALAICALTVSVATRSSVPTIFPGTTVESQLSHSMRQHLDSDAVRWVPPVAAVIIAEVVSLYPRIAPAGPPVPGLFFEETLYNRPPPAC